MTKPKKRIASTIYWHTDEERAEAEQKAKDRDESLSSMARKLFRRLATKKG